MVLCVFVSVDVVCVSSNFSPLPFNTTMLNRVITNVGINHAVHNNFSYSHAICAFPRYGNHHDYNATNRQQLQLQSLQLQLVQYIPPKPIDIIKNKCKEPIIECTLNVQT